MTYTDRMGNEVRVGDIVVYAQSIGRSQTTSVGRVLEFGEGRYGTTVKLASIQHKWERDQPRVGRSILTHPERMLKYDRKYLSPVYLELLEADAGE